MDHDALMPAMAFVTFAAKDPNATSDSFPLAETRKVIEVLMLDEDSVARALFLCRLLWQILLRPETESESEKSLALMVHSVAQTATRPCVAREVARVMTDLGISVTDNKVEVDASIPSRSQRDLLKDVGFGLPPGEYGKACPLPGSFVSILHNILRNSADYKRAVLEEIEGGGDNCGRAIVGGMIVGAWNA